VIKVSIAMATYNGAQFIHEQLQSFVFQTRQPDELIITDDCSNDQTEAIIREFAKTAPFTVEFHRNEKNLGYCGNFNAALMRTTGDLVFLSDQDDVWFPEKIEHMIGVAERHPEALVVMNNAALTDRDLNEVGLTKLGQIRSAGLTTNAFVMGCCCAISRELLNMCLPIPAGYKAHDGWIVGFAHGLDAKIIDQVPLQYYRRHEVNESRFIANRTTKVSRRLVFLAALQDLFRPDALERAIAHREQTRLLAQGIRRALNVASEKREAALAHFFETTQKRLYTLDQRLRIRRRWFLSRCVSALRFLYQGGYRNAGGLKSLVRDILG
jgi:glycosyltransferase involved in cell wall biosynthesis